MTEVLQNFIDGRFVEVRGGETLDIVNPLAGKDLSLYSVEEYTRVKHVMRSLEV